MSLFELGAILLVLTATFGWINHRLAWLPHTAGLLVMGLGASLVIIGAEAALPGLLPYEDLVGLVRQVGFQETVLDGMLAFLLFAGALHVDAPVCAAAHGPSAQWRPSVSYCPPRSSEQASGRRPRVWASRCRFRGPLFSGR